MAERPIDDGFVDCPKFGIMDEQRCIPSCESHESKDQSSVDCCFGKPRSGGNPAAGEAAEGTSTRSKRKEPARGGKK